MVATPLPHLPPNPLKKKNAKAVTANVAKLAVRVVAESDAKAVMVVAVATAVANATGTARQIAASVQKALRQKPVSLARLAKVVAASAVKDVARAAKTKPAARAANAMNAMARASARSVHRVNAVKPCLHRLKARNRWPWTLPTTPWASNVRHAVKEAKVVANVEKVAVNVANAAPPMPHVQMKKTPFVRLKDRSRK